MSFHNFYTDNIIGYENRFLIKKNLPPPHHPDFKQFSGIALRCFYLRGLTCLISRFLASADSFDVWESVELRRNESG